MEIAEASSTIKGVEICYLTCKTCRASYYDSANMSLLKQVFEVTDEKEKQE